MKIEKYNKELNYSYTLGAFPTLELIKYHKDEVINIYIHPTFKNEEVIQKIKDSIPLNKIIFDETKVFNKLSDKENVYIIGTFYKYKSKLESNYNHILLDSISNMGNLGTIIRSSLGFNIHNLVIVDQNIDYFDPKVIRSSMGSIFAFNIEHFDSLKEYKDKFKDHTIYSFMLQAKDSLYDFKFPSSLSTLAFGNEARGLPSEYLNEHPLIIKHTNFIDSLNITNAVTIALYALYNSSK